MRVACPTCGPRDLREFTVTGAAWARPDAEAGPEAWHEAVHLRANPAGPQEEYWWHGAGCGAWLVVERDTARHAVLSVRLAGEGA